jgi:hypothetical protein
VNKYRRNKKRNLFLIFCFLPTTNQCRMNNRSRKLLLGLDMVAHEPCDYRILSIWEAEARRIVV